MVTTSTESIYDEIDVDELIEQKHRSSYDPEKAPAPSTSSYTAVSKSVDVEKGYQKKLDDDMPIGPGHHSANPFAPREGKTLIWRDVNMTLAGKSGKPERKLLDNVWGEVPRKKTTAIMGPSGAGKTSLLNILAGRAATGGRITISADMRLDNYKVDPTNIQVRQSIAFVAQDDSLQVTSTPRECIYFSAKLRLPRSTTEHQLETLTNRMIEELGLVDCADTIVGGALIKGISGGQRKRTSVGVELVVKPALVFLDEPTSGLDSFSAVQLCQVLKKVSAAGSSVLFTIHQPSSEIFNSFDSLILLNHGRVMYQGPTDQVPEFFGARGHPNPPHYNPADWVMNVAQSVSKEQLEKDGFFEKDARELGDAFKGDGEGKDALGITITSHDAAVDYDESHVGFSTQAYMLYTREFRNLRRDTRAVGARIGLTSFLAILVGIIFLHVGKQDPSIKENQQSQFGALVIVLLMSMFGTAQPSLMAFPEERPVFLREYSTNHYSVVPYFLARFTVELTITGLQILVQTFITYFMVGFQLSYGIFYATVLSLAMTSTALAVMLGCSVEDPKLAQEMLPLLFVPQMLFSGFFVIPSLIPIWLRWARYLCSLTYALRIVAVAEFDQGQPWSKHFLDSIDAKPSGTWWNWLVLVLLFISFRTLGLIILKQKATKFY